jgi:hypothetical protein
MSSPDSSAGSRLATEAAGATARRKAAEPSLQSDSHKESGPSLPLRLLTLARRHWLLTALLIVGLVLRVLAVVAYRPALIYVDSLKYLYGASPGADPLGYRAFLKVVLLGGNVTAVAVLQHLLGLAMAVVIYAVLLRRGTARWLAAVAAAPVLLDAYQLQMEQTIMPDVLFEVLLVAGLAVLLWRPEITARTAIAAGLILGASATVRQVGELLVLPAVIWLAMAGGGWRRVAIRAAALVVAFALPVAAYSSYSYAKNGHFRLGRGQATVGRTAAAADCATLHVRPLVRALCPTPSEQAQGPDFLEHSKYSPLYANPLPPGAHRGQLIAALNSAVRHQQPARIAVAILRDTVRVFALTKSQAPGSTPISRWQFQASYPTYPNWVTLGPVNVIVVGLQPKPFARFIFRPLRPDYGGKAQVVRPIAQFLRSYQLDRGYTPGPLLALGLLIGAGGALLVLRRRAGGTGYHQFAMAAALVFGSAAVLLLAGDVFEFSWRYQLPALVTLPPAGLLGGYALVSWYRARRTGQLTAAGPPTGQPKSAPAEATEPPPAQSPAD